MTTDIPAPPRLTRLELQGFKSFANRTVFVFDPGITAVIGPNGSGKSNISDSVRWVLGETSHSLLRSRKTEDVIFAGGNGKAPAGMAEVTVTFDNATGWLPIEFAEVSVSRRAFRSGENQFLINGRKARLKDVQQLTASLGHSHTVVGQGLVDAALSQRPEERRGLFEHAADLTGLQLKVNEAEKNLAEAESNAERINDLLADVAPRLRTLERAATQAREWQGVRDRLHHLEQGYYRQALMVTSATLARAQTEATAGSESAERAREHVETLAESLRTARADAENTRSILERHRANLDTVADQLRRIGHERDLTAERLTALQRRQADMADTQHGIDDQLATVSSELERIDAELREALQEREDASQQVAELRRQVQRARDARSARDRQIASLASAAQTIERQLGDAHRRWSLLDQRRETGAMERDRAAAAAADQDRKIAQVETDLAQLVEADESSASDESALRQAIDTLVRDAQGAAALHETATAQTSDLARSRDEAAARLQAFQRIQESGAGLHAGVRAVLAAARAGTLAGVRGTLSELIAVKARYDTAIEVALGGHLQDIVVDRWVDAESAIEHLKSTKAGRATFQPIDAVRASRSSQPPAGLTERRGVHGIAAQLIDTGPELEAIISSLIGRTVVVDDLAVARSILPQLPPGWTAVTLTGELVRSGGSLTGGAAVRESGVLGRERELRELPAEIERIEGALAAARDEVRRLAAEPARLAENRREQEGALAGLLATRRERSGQIQRLQTWLDGLLQERSSADERTAQMLTSAESSVKEIDELEREIARLEEQLSQATTSRESLAERSSGEAEAQRESEEELGRGERLLAALEERVRSAERQKVGFAAQLRGLEQELSMRSERSSAITGEIEAIATQASRLQTEAERLEVEKARIEGDLLPVQAAADGSRSALTGIEQQLDTARQQLLDAERARGVTEIGLERARGEMSALRQRIYDDLEMEEPDDLLQMDVELEEDFEETGREISRLRERLKRVGYIGEEAVEEFERETARHHFLREQLDDVEGASSALRTLLADLRETMQRRFDETFERVAAAFAASFTVLFGGGTAQLVMVPGEHGRLGGVDIVAQPPGKRLQSLALLSGGERALTAAALLFAILKVNPTPFVLLDEVDAALDEANVVRFREHLQQLARETQAVIITHNRGTIEVADSLYGVSMREDGVSTVLSLRMKDEEKVG
ncbi:MAG: chromosome segregation protein SMC [Thermomicrobiales bacterium]|nr:chromosome segregation protein SMC [Thermomicrobiales bacterium]